MGMKLRKLFPLILLLVIILIPAGCGSGTGKPVSGAGSINLTVAAAASLKDVSLEIKSLYKSVHPGVNITYIFASSGTLQKQIEEGAPVDVFISAGIPQMDALSAKGLISEASRRDVAGNEIVLIAGESSSLTGFEGLAGAGVRKIAIGSPDIVPAGRYARETLSALNLWDRVQSKFVYAKDVRQVLPYVATGNADAGLVFYSDAKAGQKIAIIASAPAGTHDTVVYPAAAIKSGNYQKEAYDFLEFLSGRESAEIFKKYGFRLNS
ncbi:MAG: molybdate ABC transporter substrate-binding protein [Bacillota bacterium]